MKYWVSGMVTRASNPSSWEAEAAGSGVQTSPRPYSNLRPVRARGDPALKKVEREKRGEERWHWKERGHWKSVVNLLNTILEKKKRENGYMGKTLYHWKVDQGSTFPHFPKTSCGYSSQGGTNLSRVRLESQLLVPWLLSCCFSLLTPILEPSQLADLDKCGELWGLEHSTWLSLRKQEASSV